MDGGGSSSVAQVFAAFQMARCVFSQQSWSSSFFPPLPFGLNRKINQDLAAMNVANRNMSPSHI